MAEKVPQPYYFLPLVASSDEEDRPTSYPPGTLFVNRKRYYRKDDAASRPTTTNTCTSTISTAPSTAASTAANSWCKCNHCGPMPSQLELKCCFDENFNFTNFQDETFDLHKQCVTLSSVLKDHVLHHVTLQLAWFGSQRYKGATGDQLLFTNMTHSSYRFQAYRSYINFTHGYLGRKHRRVIPSCIVNYIRQQWPDPEGSYVGFKEPEELADEEDTTFVFPDELEGLLES